MNKKEKIVKEGLECYLNKKRVLAWAIGGGRWGPEGGPVHGSELGSGTPVDPLQDGRRKKSASEGGLT